MSYTHLIYMCMQSQYTHIRVCAVMYTCAYISCTHTCPHTSHACATHMHVPQIHVHTPYTSEYSSHKCICFTYTCAYIHLTHVYTPHSHTCIHLTYTQLTRNKHSTEALPCGDLINKWYLPIENLHELAQESTLSETWMC